MLACKRVYEGIFLPLIGLIYKEVFLCFIMEAKLGIKLEEWR
jgi:hypothetical protein